MLDSGKKNQNGERYVVKSPKDDVSANAELPFSKTDETSKTQEAGSSSESAKVLNHALRANGRMPGPVSSLASTSSFGGYDDITLNKYSIIGAELSLTKTRLCYFNETMLSRPRIKTNDMKEECTHNLKVVASDLGTGQ